QLEVATRGTLGAQPRAGKVRAAEVHRGVVDDDGLEVHARTHAKLEAARTQPLEAIEAVAKRPRRHRRLEQPQLHTVARETIEDAEDALPPSAATIAGDEHLLDVRAGDPHASSSPAHRADDQLVVLLVGDQLHSPKVASSGGAAEESRDAERSCSRSRNA